MPSFPKTEQQPRLSDRAVLLIQSAMTLAVLAIALWASRSIPPLRGDSAEYLYFDASRSVGYPAFLEFIRLTTGHVALAVPAQMILLAASLLLLGWRFHQLFRRPFHSLVFQLLLLAQAGLWFASAFVMTEALSAALVALWCGETLAALRSPGRLTLFRLVAIASLATMVRPPLVALFPATAIFLLGTVLRSERPRFLTLGIAALAIAWFATPIAQLGVHGSARTTSPTARGILQHTLYCDPHALPRDPDSLFVEQASAPVRRFIATAPSGVREQLRREYSTPLRFGLIIPVLGRRHHLEQRSAVDPILARIAAERVRANPRCYAAGVAFEAARMAMFDTDPSREDGDRARAFLHSHPPIDLPQFGVLPGDERLNRRAAAEIHAATVPGLNPAHASIEVVAKVPLIALLPMRMFYTMAAIIGALALLALPFWRGLPEKLRPTIAAAAALGAAFHGVIAITAIVEIAFYRYLVPLWPIVCLLLALTLLAALDRPSRRARSSSEI